MTAASTDKLNCVSSLCSGCCYPRAIQPARSMYGGRARRRKARLLLPNLSATSAEDGLFIYRTATKIGRANGRAVVSHVSRASLLTIWPLTRFNRICLNSVSSRFGSRIRRYVELVHRRLLFNILRRIRRKFANHVCDATPTMPIMIWEHNVQYIKQDNFIYIYYHLYLSK